ncbi:MAG: sugar ABC transporter substrate-binding protein [Clostridiales Family XIII bacterium]|jgi:multiple sugar transport system substrate-binding protein|nr:sugar ABC transporter substrate-binding protein [Clostridiales Family XIII bacterium]
MKKMNKVIALLLATFMVVSLAACGGKDKSSSGSSDSGSKKGSDTLTVAIWDTNQESGIKEILADFTADTGIKTDVQVTPWAQYWTMLEASATGGSLPDVCWMHANEIAKYAESGMLLDLDDAIAEQGLDMTKYPSGIVDLYQNPDGAQVAIPKDIDTIALWYNKTMFDEAGVSYPDDTWTWDTFREAAKKLTKADGSQYGTAFTISENQQTYYNIIYDFGGYVINDEKTKSGWDDPKTIEAMDFVADMIKDGSFPPYTTVSETDQAALFQSGKTAMLPQGSWMVTAMLENEYVHDNCDIAVMPSHDGTNKSIFNGLGWAAAKDSKNAENAAKLVTYLGTEAAQKKQADLGVTMSAYEDTSEGFISKDTEKNIQAYIDMQDDIVMYPYSKDTIAWNDMSIEELVKAWQDPAIMADTCKKIAAQMNDDLAAE